MYIPRRDRQDNLYHRLQQETLQMIQELCGKVWTDYNPHDPGITVSDHLHYALLELDYCLDFPFPDYLPHRKGGTPDFRKAALFSGDELFSPSVVTPPDYEQLFMSSFPQIEACRVRCQGLPLYHIRIQAAPDTDLPLLHQQVTALYHRHRNLGENLAEIRFGRIVSPAEKPEDDVLLSTGDPESEEQLISRHSGMFPFRSIQEDFPDCYGVNANGIPGGTHPSQRSRILQFKAYLSIYDYLLQAVFSQINSLPGLLEVESPVTVPGFVPFSLPDMDILVDRDRQDRTIPVAEACFHEQRALYLDMLDRMYGEDTRYLTALLAGPAATPEEENRRRVRLLRLLPGLNCNRARGCNLSDPSSGQEAVIVQLLELLLETDPLPVCSLTEWLDRHSLRFLDDERFFAEYAYLFPAGWQFDPFTTQVGEYRISEVPQTPVGHYGSVWRRSMKYFYFFWHELILESFLQAGDDPDRYRVASRKEEGDYLLLFRHTADRWLPLGFFQEQKILTSAVYCLQEFIRRFRRQSGAFYLVEHILLFPEQEVPSSDAHRVSFVFPCWHTRFRQREACESLVRERLPAHLEPCFHWVDMEDMLAFEKVYLPWREAMAGSGPEQQHLSCKELHRWLHLHTESL